MSSRGRVILATSQENGKREVVSRRGDWLAGIPTEADALLDFKGVRLLHSNRDRKVLWIPPSPSRPTLIAKIHREKDTAARWRRRLGWGRAFMEWRHLRHAERVGIPVPRPVGWQTSASGDVVFTEYLLDTEEFPNFIQKFHGTERAAILRHLGALVARLVRSGMEARDLHTGNIMARGTDSSNLQLWVVDLHDARICENVLEHRQEAMLVQVAQSLGGIRAGQDVGFMLQGWAAQARNLGINTGWGTGPVQVEDGVSWMRVIPERKKRIEQRVEKKEMRRRRRRIRRLLVCKVGDRKGVARTYWRDPKGSETIFPRRVRVRSCQLPAKKKIDGVPFRSWRGSLIESTLMQRQATAHLLRLETRGPAVSQHVVESVPAGVSLLKYGGQEPSMYNETAMNNEAAMNNETAMNPERHENSATIVETMKPVAVALQHWHLQGIRVLNGLPSFWHMDTKEGKTIATVDSACLHYQGRISLNDRLEDAAAVSALYQDEMTHDDRWQLIMSCCGLGRLEEDQKRIVLERLAVLLSWKPETFSSLEVSCIFEHERQRDLLLSEEMYARLHALNEENAPEVGSLEVSAFQKLLGSAHRVWQSEPVANTGDDPSGMLVVMTRNSDYDSPNFQWFQNGFEHFGYIDRIAVDARARKQGVGAALYLTLEAWARSRNLKRLVCEVNLEPRNEVSLAFHRSLGFREVGQYVGRGKPVVMLEKPL